MGLKSVIQIRGSTFWRLVCLWSCACVWLPLDVYFFFLLPHLEPKHVLTQVNDFGPDWNISTVLYRYPWHFVQSFSPEDESYILNMTIPPGQPVGQTSTDLDNLSKSNWWVGIRCSTEFMFFFRGCIQLDAFVIVNKISIQMQRMPSKYITDMHTLLFGVPSFWTILQNLWHPSASAALCVVCYLAKDGMLTCSFWSDNIQLYTFSLLNISMFVLSLSSC